MLKQKLNSTDKVFFAFSKENHVQHQLYYLQQKITFEDSLFCNALDATSIIYSLMQKTVDATSIRTLLIVALFSLFSEGKHL
jgi:hypothetical protein